MSVQAQRPWLALYGHRPPSIDPEHASALAMFDAALARAGELPLIHYDEHTLTLRDVDALSDSFAATLAGLRVGRGDRLALYLQNVPQFPVAVLAAWKLGATVVPVNPMWKEREVELVLRDSGARVVFCHEQLAANLPADVEVLTTPDRELALPAGAGGPPPRAPLGRDDVAFLVYTSGTTGPPKGAMNTHGNVVFAAQVYRHWVGLTSADVVLGIAPLFHVTGLVAHLAVSLLVPTPLVLAHRFDARRTLELIERHRATFTVASVTAFIALLNDDGAKARNLSSFTKLYSGGAPVAPAVADEWERRFGSPLHVVYGLTETTSPAHAVPFSARAPVDPGTGALSVGVPVFDTVARIVDDDGAELPPGEVGELAIRGPQVVPGYWGKPQETAHAFPDGELRTGDVGLMDARGWFYLVDRKKDLINASGFKVWPREVEDVLYRHPAVREAAVVGLPDPYRGETVAAFVSLKAGAAAAEEELTAFCRDQLAAYKVPRSVRIVDDLPKTATGKILRRELRTPLDRPPPNLT